MKDLIMNNNGNNYTTIVLHRKVWTKQSPKNQLKWTATLPDGKIIVENSANPVREASVALLLDQEWNAETLITFRHADSEHDSFKPMALGLFAEQGVKNEIKRLQAVAKRAEIAAPGSSSRFNGFPQSDYPKDISEAVAPLCKALRSIQELREAA